MKKPKEQPEPLVLRFLKVFCPNHLYEEIEGDLTQRFNRDVKNFGEKRAKRRLVWNALRFFRPGIILRNKSHKSFYALHMISNYFKIASRIMIRNKAYSMINVFGLALGMTSAMLLFLWIQREFTYDQFHEDKERIYKAWNRNTFNGELACWDRTPRILAPTLAENYAAVESAVTYSSDGTAYLFTVGDKKLMKKGGVFTDSQFLTMFSFPLVKGDPAKALVNPSSIVVTENFAIELFGNKEAYGETVTISEAGNEFSFTVTGVLKNLPSNSDFNFPYLIPLKFVEDLEGKQDDWGNNGAATFVKLKKGASFASLNDEIKDITIKHSRDDNNTEVFLYPLTKMHLYAKFENGVPSGGRIEIMHMLMLLGGCLIAIACINFVNLSTARAQRRSREVGVRKVTGAFRLALVIQFLCESVLIALGAGIIALIATYICLPWFSQLVEQQLSLRFTDFTFWVYALLAIFSVGLCAGAYPALYLSSFNPARILKGVPLTMTNRNLVRKTLVVVQFGFAVMLIFSVVIIYKQIDYVQHREAGYNRKNLIYHFITGDLEKNYSVYKRELLQSGYIESVTRTSSPITEGWSNTWALQWEGKDPDDKTIINRFNVDEGFAKTAGVHLLEGRDMDLERFPSDSRAVLLNESAVRTMQFKNPIGEIIKDGNREWHVVGVIKDFVQKSPYQKIEPMILQGSDSWFNVIHIKLNAKRPSAESIEAISKLFTKHNSAYPFEYYFVDQSYQRKFSSLEGTLKITSIFSGIAICIACLGLLGLSTYMIESRVKEISIRKVLGGSALSIIRLLSGHALRPIILATIIFGPLAWVAMNWWLQSFDYRIAPSIWIIAGAALFLLLAQITIISQTFQASKTNPAKNLKAE